MAHSLAHSPHFPSLCVPHHVPPQYAFLSLGPAYNHSPIVLLSSAYTPTLLLDRIIAKSSFYRALFMCDSYLESGHHMDIQRLANEKQKNSLVAIILDLFSLPWPSCLLFLLRPLCHMKNKWIVYIVSSRGRYSMILRNKLCNWEDHGSGVASTWLHARNCWRF